MCLSVRKLQQSIAFQMNLIWVHCLRTLLTIDRILKTCVDDGNQILSSNDDMLNPFAGITS
jgi:hypothetical protein